MKALLAHNYYKERGGEDTVYEEERRLLEEHGYEIRPLSVWNDKTSPGNLAFNLFLAKPSTQLVRRAEVLCRGVDVAHMHNGFPLLGEAVVRAAKANQVPVIQTIHNYRPTCLAGTHFRDGRVCFDCPLASSNSPGIRHACYRNSTILSAGAARHSNWQRHALQEGRITSAICLTALSRQRLVDAGVPESRLFVKPNFVADSGPGAQANGELLFVGRHSVEKGLPLLLDELEARKPTRPVTIVGRGPFDDRIQKLVKQYPGLVRQTDRLSRHELLERIGNAGAILLPSIWLEGLPMTALEAFMKGTPVAASTTMAWPREYPSPAILPIQVNEPGWLGRLLDDNDSWQASRKRAARELYQRKFSPEANYAQLQDIYRRTMEMQR